MDRPPILEVSEGAERERRFPAKTRPWSCQIDCPGADIGRLRQANAEKWWRACSAVRRANARSRATPPSPWFARASDADYLPTLTDCDATACHRPSRITQTSVQTYLPLLSLPLYVLFSVSLPVATAVLPKTLTLMAPISYD